MFRTCTGVTEWKLKLWIINLPFFPNHKHENSQWTTIRKYVLDSDSQQLAATWVSPCSAHAEVNSWSTRRAQGQNQSLPAHQRFSNLQNSKINLFGATKCQNWVLSFKESWQGETVGTQKPSRQNCGKVCRPCKAKTNTGGRANITNSNKGTTTRLCDGFL